MINYNPEDIDIKKNNELNILILQNSDDNYCTASRDWSSVIMNYHPKTELVKYIDIYSEMGHSKFFEYLLKKITITAIDVIYFDTAISTLISLDQLRTVRKICFVVVVLDDNALFFQDWYRYTSQAVDLVLTHDYVEKFRYKLYGTDSLFVPQISDLESFYLTQVDYSKKDIFLSSIGRVDRVGRREFINVVMDTEIPFENYGPGTNGGFVNSSKKIDIFQRSMIGLNFSGSAEYFHEKHVQKIEKNIRQVKGRIWELALSKCMVMTEYAPCLEHSFDIGSEIIVFETPQDLVEKLNYFRQNPDKVFDIALKGYERAKKDVNPFIITDRLLHYIRQKNRNKSINFPNLVFDHIYLKKITAERSTHSLDLLQRFRLSLAIEQLKLSWVEAPRLIPFFIKNLVKEFVKRRMKKSKAMIKIVRKGRSLLSRKSY